MSLDRDIQDILGNFDSCISKVAKETLQHVDEIMRARKTNNSLRRHGYWTADCAAYTIEEGDVILYLTRSDSNPFLTSWRAVDSVVEKNGFYPIKADEFAAVKRSSSTLRINLSELDLNVWDMYAVVHKDSGDNNKKLLERIGNTKAYVLNPKFVQKNIKEGEAFAMPCYLFSEAANNIFCVGYEFVRTPHCRVRGMIHTDYQRQNTKLVSSTNVVPIKKANEN